VPRRAFPLSAPSTDQRIVLVEPPVSVALKVTVFAAPEGTVTGPVGEVIITTGAGVMVTVEVAERFWSSKDSAATVTVLGEGT